MNLTLSDTLTRKTQSLYTHAPNGMRMYVCGITPYDFAHIGHGRAYVTFDLLFRLLNFLGYKVIYCRNFTDIDDKLIVKAEQLYQDPTRFEDVAQEFIKAFHEDLSALNCLAPTIEPRVTESIDIIIDFIQRLIDKDVAYVSNGDVYFHVPQFKHYAKLSKHALADLQAGARIEVSEKKRHPLDFALWKHEPKNKFWESPWGNGRPGWHIECSAMAHHHLGEQIDIHGGGMDLIFPHHENEIAQTEALTEKPFANIWMHVALVRVDKEKMSKSLGNFFTLRDVFKAFDPMVVRFYYLTHHYRSPLDFSFKDLEVAQKTYQRLCKDFEKFSCQPYVASELLRENPIVQSLLKELCNDLNTPALFGQLFSQLDTILADEQTACAVKSFLQLVLGLNLQPLPEKHVEITPEIQKLINEREKARREKNWQRADELREKLKKLGIEVKDQKL